MDTNVYSVVVDESLRQTKEVAHTIELIKKQQEDSDYKVNKEIRAHSETKQKVEALKAAHVQTHQAADNEAKNHMLTREKLEKEERSHAKTRDALHSANEDVNSMRMQMDAMKVELEAQRKAFVINVNWAARCTELKTKFDQSTDEYDELLDKHVKSVSEVEASLRSSEQFRMKHQAAVDAYNATQDEIARKQEELTSKSEVTDEIAKKLAELDEFRARTAEEETKKKLGNQQALSVLQRSLAAGESGLKTSAFAGWSSLTATLKKERLHKDRAMKRAVKLIADEGTALCAETFGDWRTTVENEKRAQLLAATKRLEEASAGAGAGSMAGRQRAIKQLEKQFQGEDFSLLKSTFQGWALGQIERKKREQNHKKASRLIANSGQALVAEVFHLWNDQTEVRRRKNKQQAANMQVAGRMIANNDKVFQMNIFTNWWGMIEEIRAKRKVDEAGTAKAMRMLANSGVALMNLCFDSWMKDHMKNKDKDAGNKKALRMMANSGQALCIAVWGVWKKMTGTQGKKNSGMAKAVRMINSSNEALTAAVFQSWSGWCSKNKDKNKKMRALEKSFGAQDAGRKMVVFTAWQGDSKVEGRKKRAKEHSMKSAIKSITGNQDILLCHLTLLWAKFASGSKMEKLQESIRTMESQVQEAVDKARVALQGDVDKAQQEVDSIAAELENMKKQRDQAKSNIEGLEGLLGDTTYSIGNYERQMESISKELEQSRRKAKDIGEELGKVGVFITGSRPRSGSNSRPRSGNKNSEDKSLPRIDGSNSRPHSGSKTDGSKSARGVPGERGGSGRREGRPPVNPVSDKRYLMDGSGPYTYNEFLEIYAEKGRENALVQWNASMAPVQQDVGPGESLPQ